MKKTLLTSVLLAVTFLVKGQTATNFTATDCNSNSHTLFTELDNGKVVVLVWIMPCGLCISDAIAAYNAVQSFASSHPGKVLYYLSDDFGNTSCSTLETWANTNGIGSTNRVIFSNSGIAIDENNYGGTGMPHVVVIGGTDHHIYFNVKNGSNNGTAITNAINQAIAATSVPETTGDVNRVTVYPSPAKNEIFVSYSLFDNADVNLDIVSVTGEKVRSLNLERQTKGKHEVTIRSEDLSNGMYFVNLRANGVTRVMKFIIAK